MGCEIAKKSSSSVWRELPNTCKECISSGHGTCEHSCHNKSAAQEIHGILLYADY